MKRSLFGLGLLSVGLLFTGCHKPGAAKADAASGATSGTSLFQPYLDHAQPKLPTVKLWLGAEELTAEVAKTSTQIYTGMMYREKMGENEAMIFVFPEAAQRSFYMRNTLLPLSCAYIDPEGTIIEIHDLQPKDETPVNSKSGRIQFVLETRQGWFKRHRISPGTVIRTERGPLQMLTR